MRRGKADLALRWALDRLGAHTGTAWHCTDVVETGVGADGPAHTLHTGMGSGAWEQGCIHNARLVGQNG